MSFPLKEGFFELFAQKCHRLPVRGFRVTRLANEQKTIGGFVEAISPNLVINNLKHLI